MKLLSVLLPLYLVFSVAGEDSYESFSRAFPQADVAAIPQFLFNAELEATPYAYTYNPAPFVCSSLPTPADTDNVNELTLGHIKVVMAMGDSISVAYSVFDETVGSLHAWPGVAFNIGANPGVYSVPNFLAVVNGFAPVGGATGNTADNSEMLSFDFAVSGAKSADMLGQAKNLVTKLKSSTSIDFNNDWKLLTLWIGSNNLCDVCNDNTLLGILFGQDNSADSYQTNVQAALQYIYDNVPRCFVNLISPLNVTTLYNIAYGTDVDCVAIHQIECPCVGSLVASIRAEVSQAAGEYQQRSYAIAEYFNSKNKPDFAVVVQPFLEQTVITERDIATKADYFHPSAKGHAVGAVALWNNMLTPAASKKKSWV